MPAESYPNLSDLIASWFHQDFDIEGEAVAEVMAACRRVMSNDEREAVRSEIAQFLSLHANDLEAAFERTFKPDVIPSVLSGSTRAFLEEISQALS
jgi:hypothetical protein